MFLLICFLSIWTFYELDTKVSQNILLSDLYEIYRLELSRWLSFILLLNTRLPILSVEKVSHLLSSLCATQVRNAVIIYLNLRAVYFPVLIDFYASIFAAHPFLFVIFFPLNIYLLEIVTGLFLIASYGHNVAWYVALFLMTLLVDIGITETIQILILTALFVRVL